MTLFCFDGRGHAKVRNELERAGAEVLVMRLDSGDVSFLAHNDHSVGVELKTADDLLGSLRSGRLFDQASRMILEYKFSLVLAFGFLTSTREGFCRTKTGVKEHPPWPTFTQLTNAMLSLNGHGIIVLPIVPNEKVAAQVLISVNEWFRKGVHQSLLKRQMPFTMGSQDNIRAIHIVTGCPRVSVGLATRLLSHFGTAQAVLSASIEELQEVRGIGKVVARSIHRAARAKYKEGK